LLWVCVGVLTSLSASAQATTAPSDTQNDGGGLAGPVVSGSGVSPDSTPTWREARVVLTVDPSYLALPYAREALAGALAAWTSSASELPEVDVVEEPAITPPVDGGVPRSDHRISFASGGEPRANGALAITLLTVDEEAKNIIDGDIVINGGHSFTDVTTYGNVNVGINWGNYDLQNVVTHELGHWFGLAENYDNAEATMFAYVDPGEIKKRDLDPQDVTQAQLAYWHADNPSRHTGCAVIPGAPAPRTSTFGFMAASILLLIRSNRRVAPHVLSALRRQLSTKTRDGRGQLRRDVRSGRSW
jgi:hypothetical protein